MNGEQLATAGFVWAVVVVLAGLIFQLGRQSMRLDHLYEWRTELREEMKELHGHLDRGFASVGSTANDHSRPER